MGPEISNSIVRGRRGRARRAPRPRRLTVDRLENRLLLSLSVGTDKPDYIAGETACISASGLTAGEEVQFQVAHDAATPELTGAAGHDSWAVQDGATGDLDGAANGAIVTRWFVHPDDSTGSRFVVTAVGSLGESASAHFANARFSGAVFTTTADGTVVNENIYSAKSDVYINGGPQNVQHAGLPDGTYFYQVTAPGWHPSQADLTEGLLSTDDAIHRQLTVVDGVVSGVPTDGDFHALGALNPANGSTPVQLAPFADSANPGGEYKVWLIRYKDADGNVVTDRQGNPVVAGADPDFNSPVLIFRADNAKTDNFKVEPAPTGELATISGTKFQDVDGVPSTTADDVPLAGWTIQLYNANGELVASAITGDGVTAPLGTYTFTDLQPGDYSVLEVLISGWTQTFAPPDPITVASGENLTGQDFGNIVLIVGSVPGVTISGTKFNDVDGVAATTDDDVPLGGWIIQLRDAASGELVASTITGDGVTAPLGSYSFTDIGPGTYRILEIQQPGWAQTFGPVEPITVASGVDLTGLDFGNHDFGPGGAPGPTISGTKFTDITGDGFSADDTPLGSDIQPVIIQLHAASDNSLVALTVTDASGNYFFNNVAAGQYFVTEETPDGWTQTDETAGAIDTADLATLTGNDFANFQNVSISGMKFCDDNANGVLDDGEEGLNGWRIRLLGDTTAITVTTAGGQYSFANLGPGTYTVSEALRRGWVQTAGSGGYTIVVGGPAGQQSGQDVTDLDFGNVRLGRGGARPLEFWEHTHDPHVITADDLTALGALSLRNADGSDFDPATAAELQAWLDDADNVNMAYLLSAQVAVMELNVLDGFVDGDAMIYAPDAASANAAGFTTVDALLADADAELAAHPLTTSDGPDRDAQQALEEALHNANQNHTFVRPCPQTAAPGIFDPEHSVFFLRNSHDSGGADEAFGFGVPHAGWIPITGDWDGDGSVTAGLYDPASSMFYLRNSNSTGIADSAFGFGAPGAGWIPIAGHWVGDKAATVGLYDPAHSLFYLRHSNSAGVADETVGFGEPGWKPVMGDWDGNGTTTIGLFNPAQAAFFLKNANTTGFADIAFSFGAPGADWKPLSGDWSGSGGDAVGVYDPSTSTYFLRDSHTTGIADLAYGYGAPGAGWIPLSGDWKGHEGESLLVDAGLPAPAHGAPALSSAELPAIVAAAIGRFSAAGLSVADLRVLENTSVSIADLALGQLGDTAAGAIYVSPNAAGHGWFVDSTPDADEEFGPFGANGQAHAIDPHAVDRIDLLTVVEHELGHIAGLDDSSAVGSLMSGMLPTGARRNVTANEIDAILAAHN